MLELSRDGRRHELLGYPWCMSPDMASRPRALLLENIDRGAAELLEQAGWEVELLGGALEEPALVERLDGVELLGIRSQSQVTETVLESSPSLVAVGAFCIGTNQIDLSEATRRGVAVFNAPFSNTRSVVELALAEIIALTRRLTDKDRAMHAGVWDKSAVGSHEVRGRSLGIVGYGNIGTQLSVLAEGIGMSVYFYDTADRLALGNARRCATLEELLESVDVVSLHVDGRPDNRDFFGEAEFARMRSGSLFLNLSRGFVVDHAALRASIESGRLAGAAIDVFPEEPSGKGEPFVSELQGVDNVILTPHVGGSTEEAQVDIGQFVAHKLVDYMCSGGTTLSVNLPNVELAHRLGSHALVHVHRNTPGVLARINNIFAENKVNIEGQALGTRGEVGYVITDIASDFTEEMLGRLARLDETIRIRCL
ncbi:MAG: D-isomer specific 2-hydroxyacid dehydrogenase NAD-binding [Acidimicrobiaceae bacterium]|nr:D-isomer specific 2-hydroxyacid dehydrogenase NAD-binding [Acidimicrobiaceae bacterium]